MQFKDKARELEDDLKISMNYSWNDMELVIEEGYDTVNNEECHIIDIYVTPICIHRLVAPKDTIRADMLKGWEAFLKKTKTVPTDYGHVLCVKMDADCAYGKYVTCKVYPYHSAITFCTYGPSGIEDNYSMDYSFGEKALMDIFRNGEAGITEMMLSGRFTNIVAKVSQC